MNHYWDECSRRQYYSGHDKPTESQVQVGCLQRIASALEKLVPAVERLKVDEIRQEIRINFDQIIKDILGLDLNKPKVRKKK